MKWAVESIYRTHFSKEENELMRAARHRLKLFLFDYLIKNA